MNNKEVLIENLKLIYGTSFNYNGAKTYYDKKKEEEGFNRSSCSGKNSIKSIKDILSLLEYNEKEKQAVYLSHYSFTNPEEPETTAIFNCLYLDFDLNDKNLLLAEEVITKQELEKLSVEEINNLVSKVETEEKQKLQGLTIEEKRKYFHNKFTSTKYLEAPFNEAKKVAATIVAVPGTSEHHIGLAVDFNSVEESFENTKAFRWLQENAEDYGFVMRYPKDKKSITKIIYEPWHYRYVGVEHAKAMNDLGLCMEEYLEYLENGGVLN